MDVFVAIARDYQNLVPLNTPTRASAFLYRLHQLGSLGGANHNLFRPLFAFKPFNPSDYLETVEYVATYLEASIEEYGDDSVAIKRALNNIARSRNFSEIARQAGMSREGLYKTLSEDGNPSLATVIKVSHALGLKLRFVAA